MEGQEQNRSPFGGIEFITSHMLQLNLRLVIISYLKVAEPLNWQRSCSELEQHLLLWCGRVARFLIGQWSLKMARMLRSFAGSP